jgi:hypothetical protein
MMGHRGGVLLLLAVSCGGAGSKQAVRDDAPADPCRAQDQLGACLEQQRETCGEGAGAEVHRLVYDTLPPMVVGARMIRLDHLGGTLLGADSARWLACFESCPGAGAPRKMCFPLALPLRLSWSADPTCERATREAAPWHGQPARSLELSCSDGPASLRFVPGLEGAAAALRWVKAIPADDVLSSVDGLVVEMSAGGAVQTELTEEARGSCADLALPAGYRVVGSTEDFAALEGISAAPAAALAEEVEKVRAAVAVEAVARAKAELLPRFRETLGEDCRARGKDPAVDAELEACVSGMPETEAPFRAAVGRETARLLHERRAELDEMTRTLLVAPVCAAYAAR